MERDCKRKKMKKREGCEDRSPLQCLNGLPFYKRNTTKSSDISSSSAPNSSRFLLSDHPCSSSRTHLDKKPRSLSRLAKTEGNKSNAEPRYKENEMPRKPLLQRSRKGKPQFTAQGQNWAINAKPTCKKLQRSNLSSVQSRSEDKLEKGFRGFQRKLRNPEENGSGKYEFKVNRASNDSNSNCSENSTPMSGRLASGYGDSLYERENANGNANSDSDVKTPPIEASLSPEIEFQTQPKMLVLKSVGTPVVYGAGHLVSGVSDKRKSRRRGSLRGGPEKTILFSDASRDENVSDGLEESLIPLLGEASVRWYSSPSDVGLGSHIVGCGNRLDQSRVVCDDDLGTLELLSLPSISCGSESNLLCGTSRDSTILKVDSLDNGNIITTPDSNSSSEACFGRSRLDAHLSNSVWSELDPITETLERVKLSPKLQENVDSVSSWVSDSTMDDLTLSRMRISWCEGLESKNAQIDESDCCCCLSDEEVVDKETFKVNEGDGFRVENEFSPVVIDYEPHRVPGKKGESLSVRPDSCAESISTDGGGLAASSDSDWTCFQEHTLFHAT